MISNPFSFCAPSLRRMRLLLALAPTACLIASGPVLAQQPSTPPPTPVPNAAQDTTVYDIHRTFKVGDVDRYRLVNKMLVNSPETGGNFVNVDMQLTVKQLTKSAKPDGTAVLTTTFENATAVYNDQPIDLMTFLSNANVTMTLNKFGKVSDSKSDGVQGPLANANIDQMIAQATSGLYPDTPVKIGDSWKFETSRNMQGMTIKVAGTSTLVGIETIDGIKTFKIKTVIDNADKNQVNTVFHAESTSNLDAQTGKVVRIAGKVNYDVDTTKAKGNITATRLTEKAATTTPAPKP